MQLGAGGDQFLPRGQELLSDSLQFFPIGSHLIDKLAGVLQFDGELGPANILLQLSSKSGCSFEKELSLQRLLLSR